MYEWHSLRAWQSKVIRMQIRSSESCKEMQNRDILYHGHE
jgi:hypothetical protein